MDKQIRATRYHDISAGHRVFGHESKCRHLHGHNYRIHFEVRADNLDAVGRVMDFSVIKTRLCMWLEDNWDHKFLLFDEDTAIRELVVFIDDIVPLPFNPTAENMAKYLVQVIGPKQLEGTGCTLVKCIVEETRKCSASFEIE